MADHVQTIMEAMVPELEDLRKAHCGRVGEVGSTLHSHGKA